MTYRENQSIHSHVINLYVTDTLNYLIYYFGLLHNTSAQFVCPTLQCSICIYIANDGCSECAKSR